MTAARLDRVLTAAEALTEVVPGVAAVGLVGSYARGAARPDSDIDLVVLVDEPAPVLDRSDWYAIFGNEVELIRSGNFGAIQERRLRLDDSTVVEVGIGDPTWAATDPIDAGTRRVVSDGLVPLHDPHGLLRALVEAALTGRGATSPPSPVAARFSAPRPD